MPKFVDEKIKQKAISLLSSGIPIKVVSAEMNISYTTLYFWAKKFDINVSKQKSGCKININKINLIIKAYENCKNSKIACKILKLSARHVRRVVSKYANHLINKRGS